MRRTTPLSDNYGWERGLPVDRHYIEAFMRSAAGSVRGEVLEVQAPLYTWRFGGDRVTGSHIVDIDPANPAATLVADLCAPGSLPADAYDCIILTQTLQLLGDAATALENLWQALRPGGTLLLTAPCLARIDLPPMRDSDYWRYTPAGLHRQLRAVCVGGEIDVSGPGNVLSCVAYLFGLAAQELTEEELTTTDGRFPLIACAKVIKPARPT